MDWFDILLALLILGVPLLELLGGRSAKRRALPPDGTGVEDTQGTAMERGSAGSSTPRRSQGGWEEAPESNEEWSLFEGGSQEEEASEERSAEAASLERESAAPEMLVPEAVRVDHPVVSLEPLDAEPTTGPGSRHDRLKRAYPPVIAPAPPATPSHSLRDPAALRRAILLAEVLGPPRALQPAERERE